ncbi:11617_t:CDS:1 [Ambispora leptoticha]|uniref:11617_t:CDS:1 n=1 Tax=Ambispora leptoticha TaxID=144679 RepID=A0A9N9CVY7_9GLOM|nr:11617_t:CDS:1 [Ambispora leptoticha]
MAINHNFESLQDPSIQSLADLINLDGSLPNNKNSFKYSVYNPCHYPRMANEIMEKLFASQKSKLSELITELEKEEASLITSAQQEVKNTIDSCRNNPHQTDMEKKETNIVCEIFEKIPACALNLLVLIKIKPEYFPQSYISFEQMLNDFNREDGGRYYGQDEIKGYFSEALQELEKLVKKTKKKKEEPMESPQPTPANQDQPEEEKKDTPTNSGENPATPNSPKDQTPKETNEPPPNLANLQALKDQTISEITAALNQIPPLTNSDLPSEYQD